VRLLHIGEQTNDVLLLVIELGEKLAVLTRPNSDRAILATGEDVVCVGINGSDCATVSVIDLPKLGTLLDVEASEETITPSSHYCLVILCDETADTSSDLGRHHGHNRLVLRKIPNFKSATFINSGEHVTILTEANIVNAGAMGVRVEHEGKIVSQDTVHLTGDCSNNHLLLVVVQVD